VPSFLWFDHFLYFWAEILTIFSLQFWKILDIKRTRSSWPQVGVILADFWGFQIFPKGPPLWNDENKSCLNDIKFWEVSGNPKNKQILKVAALYVMWNPEICQDPPTCGQDDLVLSFWNKLTFSPESYICVLKVAWLKKKHIVEKAW